MTTILLYIFFSINHSFANSEATKSDVCVMGKSYMPPKTLNHPHIIQAENINIVLWTNIISKLETEPWQLINKEICFAAEKIKVYNNSLEIVVERRSDIIIQEKEPGEKDAN